MKIFRSLILPIILLVFIAGAIVYFTVFAKKPEEKKIMPNPANTAPIVLGDSDEAIDKNTDVADSDEITDGNIYNTTTSEIRKPINTAFEDLNSKLKYKTLFSDADTQKAINDLKNLIEESINKIKNLKINAKFSKANEMHLESLSYLGKSIDAFDKMFNTTDQDEKQKQTDLYGFNIDKSNAILKEIAIPQ